MTDVRRLGIAEVEARLGVCRRTVANWVRDGKFPAPHYVAGLRRWLEHELEAWERVNVTVASDRPRPTPSR